MVLLDMLPTGHLRDADYSGYGQEPGGVAGA